MAVVFDKVGVLILSGWDEDVAAQYAGLEELFTKRGWLTRVVELPGPCISALPGCEGSRPEHLSKVISAFDELRSALADEAAQVAVVGFSYGAYMAALLTQFRKVSWLALRSPAIYSDEGWDLPKSQLDKRKQEEVRHQSLGPADNKVLAACARYKGDVLVVSCGADEVIPLQTVDDYWRAFPHPRWATRAEIAPADHALSQSDWRLRYVQIIDEWLATVRKA